MSNTVIPGVYRQHILAGVVIAGHQPVRIDTHGGGAGAEGSHITATFVIWIRGVGREVICAAHQGG